MNKAVSDIVDILRGNDGVVTPKVETRVVFKPTISYTNDVEVIDVDGVLKSVSFSSLEEEDDMLTFEIESDAGTLLFDYHMKGNYTMVYGELKCGDAPGEYVEYNDTIDRNLPIKVLRQILKSIQ